MEIVRLNLENEIDLILAHKRSMKLAELCGLSLLIQTSFATAVSEISRCVIGDEKDKPCLSLGINIQTPSRKELVATITSNKDFEKNYPEALQYARKLADNLQIVKTSKMIEIQFIQAISFSGLINDAKLEAFINYFKKELPISPYDELRKKNIQLLDIADKLRESENQYRLLTETLPLMIFTANPAGNVTYGNKWMKDFFRIAEIPSAKSHWSGFIHAPDKKILEEWDKSLGAQTAFRAQARLQVKSGEEPLWHLVTLIPVKNEQGQLSNWTGFFVDIHAQKRVEETLKNNEELKASQKQLMMYQLKLEEKVSELNKSNHDLEQFAYIASHDLQEPLRKIRNFSDLLEKGSDHDETSRKYIRKIDQSSDRMLTLIRDVLNYSKLSRSDDAFVKVSLNEVLKNVLVDMELKIEEKQAVIKMDPLPQITALPQQIFQLFNNLMSNALKFCSGKPEIFITCKKLNYDEIGQYPDLHISVNYYEIKFRDNGVGFDEKYASQVFTIFKRLHARDKYPGTGIGLALCKKIMDNHDGIIRVRSEVNKGTEYTIVLPEE